MLSKKELKKIHEVVDPSQLLDIYGGMIKLGDKLWPPQCTLDAPDAVPLPINQPESPQNKYLFDPTLNRPWSETTVEGATPENYREIVIEEKTSPISVRMQNLRKADRQITDIKIHLKPVLGHDEEQSDQNEAKDHKPIEPTGQSGNSSNVFKSPEKDQVPVTESEQVQAFDPDNQTELVKVIDQESQPQDHCVKSQARSKRYLKACCQLI